MLEQNDAGQLRFQYAGDWLADPARLALSQSLPLRPEPFDSAATRPFFAGLLPEALKPASSLTLPSRKRLELAKSLAMKPKVLLLDEVNAGLNTSEIGQALDLIRAIAARGITIVIVEHLMKVVLSLSQRILVLHHGELISSGPSEQVVNDPKVIEAYLGSKFAERQRMMSA